MALPELSGQLEDPKTKVFDMKNAIVSMIGPQVHYRNAGADGNSGDYFTQMVMLDAGNHGTIIGAIIVPEKPIELEAGQEVRYFYNSGLFLCIRRGNDLRVFEIHRGE